jgi:hypothetical protein
MVDKNGRKSRQSDGAKLTKNKQKILDLLKIGFPVKIISNRLKISDKYIYRVKNEMIQRGLFSKYDLQVENIETTQSVDVNQIRLHAEHFVVKILHSDMKKYKSILQRSNRISLDGNTIELNKSCVEIYSHKSFLGETPSEVDSIAMVYWFKQFRSIENDLGILLLKNRSCNIKRVNAHYSQTNNELAKTILKKKDQSVRLVGDDGKSWLIVDDSFNLIELETIHPETAKNDMEQVIQPFFNTLRSNPTIIDDISKSIQVTQDQLQLLVQSQKQLIDFLTPKYPKTNSRLERGDYIG